MYVYAAASCLIYKLSLISTSKFEKILCRKAKSFSIRARFSRNKIQSIFLGIPKLSVVRRVIGEGAVPVFMSKLLAADPVEICQLKFHEAVTGKTGLANTPISRARVRLWLKAIYSNFAGVSALPAPVCP